MPADVEVNDDATPMDEPARDAVRPLIEAAEQRYRTAEDRALFVIRSAIDLGIFGPGERLAQDRLASLFGCSRQPVRSALRQLESEGFVTLEPHRGAAVRQITSSEIQDLYELRILVESFALRRVAAETRDADLGQLEELAAKVDSATSPGERASRMDEFYRKLYMTANTARVVALVMQLRSEVNRYGAPTAQGPQTHRELLDALGMDDPDLAAAWLAAHLRKLARRAGTGSSAEDSHEDEAEPPGQRV